jgi:hypothetical protein
MPECFSCGIETRILLTNLCIQGSHEDPGSSTVCWEMSVGFPIGERIALCGAHEDHAVRSLVEQLLPIRTQPPALGELRFYWTAQFSDRRKSEGHVIRQSTRPEEDTE